MKPTRLTGSIGAGLFALTLWRCSPRKTVEPDFPPTRAYYTFRVFKPTDPREPRNAVGFDTLTYRAGDGSTHLVTNRTVYFTNDYDTTIYANVPADRILEGYLFAYKAQSVTLELGLIDKSGAKQKQDYQVVGINNQNPAVPVPVRVRVQKEVPLADLKN